jgi:DNA-binding transcriptional MocR family regulator
VTVQRAIARLVAEGLVETRPGAGNYLTARPEPEPADTSWQAAALGAARPSMDGGLGSGIRSVATDVIGLHTGYPSPELLPTRLLTLALHRATRDPEATLSTSPIAGLPDLRRFFADELSRACPGAVPVGEAQVLITSGGQNALSAALQGLTRPGDTVVMESPTFWGAIGAARAAGLRIAPVGTGPAGIDPGDLHDALTRHHAQVFYAQPTYANPTGVCWPDHVRADVHDVLRSRKAFMIEDDWARDLGLEASSPTPMAAADPDGHVIYIRSLTKSLSPAIRVAALVARGPAAQRITAGRWVADLYVSPLLQRTAIEAVRHPNWQRHLRLLRAGLTLRRDSLHAALTQHAPALTPAAPPDGGLSLWVRLPPGQDSTDVAARCLHAGLAVSPGQEWFPSEPDSQYLRLSYASTPAAQHEQAAHILQRICG